MVSKSDDSPAICVAPTELGAVEDRKTFTIAVTSAEMEALPPVAPPLNVKACTRSSHTIWANQVPKW